MKVIVCFGDTRVLVPCDGDDMTIKDLTDKAVTKYKKMTNKSPEDEIKVSHIKTQSEGAMVDPDDKVTDVAEDKDVFTAICEEPLSQLINTSNGQVVLAVINNDGGITPDSIIHTMQLNQAGHLSSLSPAVSNAVGMLQQSFLQQNAGSHSSSLPSVEDDNVGVDMPNNPDEKDSKNEFKCDQCPKKFKQSWKLRQHLIAHARQEEMKKYECDKCAASFTSEWLLLRHTKIHSGPTKPRFCLVCNRAFRSSTDLKVHMRVHTGERPFKCESCPKAFGDRSALRRHTMTHTGMKPRPCPHCPQAFRQTAPLIQHMRQKHNINIRHRCSVCYMSFCEDDAYVIHMANIHHKNVSVTDEKKAEEDLQHEELDDANHEVSNEGVGLVGSSEDDQQHEEKTEMEDGTEHLVQEEDNKEEDLVNNEQVVAEQSIQEGFIQADENDEEQRQITISTSQGTQDIVLPADLVVAHQLIAVQQSNMEVQ